MSERLWDPGTQAERTALAWQRTGLSAVVVGALLTQIGPGGQPLPPWPGLLVVVFGVAAAALVAPLRYAGVLRAARAGRTPLSTSATTAAAVLVVTATVWTAAVVVLVA
jgi:uncharacterized membrane protein YidH (DUF202 family)